MRLTTIEQFKGLVGKTIYAIPTGTNIIRTKGINYDFTFNVVAANVKYVELRRPSGMCDNYLPCNGATQNQVMNGYALSGFKFFSSSESLELYSDLLELKGKLKSRMSNTLKINCDDLSLIENLDEALKLCGI